MIKKLMAITILLVVILGVSGCTVGGISDEEEATEVTLEVSESLDDLTSTLEEIDSDLSG